MDRKELDGRTSAHTESRARNDENTTDNKNHGVVVLVVVIMWAFLRSKYSKLFESFRVFRALEFFFFFFFCAFLRDEHKKQPLSASKDDDDDDGEDEYSSRVQRLLFQRLLLSRQTKTRTTTR